MVVQSYLVLSHYNLILLKVPFFQDFFQEQVIVMSDHPAHVQEKFYILRDMAVII